MHKILAYAYAVSIVAFSNLNIFGTYNGGNSMAEWDNSILWPPIQAAIFVGIETLNEATVTFYQPRLDLWIDSHVELYICWEYARVIQVQYERQYLRMTQRAKRKL